MSENIEVPNNNEIYKTLGITEKVYAFGEKVWVELSGRFAQIDRVAEYNQLKVINAMQEAKVSEACLLGTTGYGYNDLGRDTLETVYAKLFHTQDALVRPQITCGTHALALALMSNLRPGEELLSWLESLMIPWRKLSAFVLPEALWQNMGSLTGKWICFLTEPLIMRILKRQ